MMNFFGALRLLFEIIQAVKALASFIEANKKERWFQDAAKTFGELKDAKTPDQKRQLALRVRDVFVSLG